MKLNIMMALIFALVSVGAHASTQKDFSPRTTFPFVSGTYRVDDVPKNTIYITIDDGPTQGVTDRILDLLDDYNIKATFFVVGNRASSHQWLIREERVRGHRIGNHSYSHEFDFASENDFLSSLKGTHNAYASFLEEGDMYLFRAPGGIWNNWRANVGNEDKELRKYVGPIYWNVGGGDGRNKDDADWKCWTKRVSVKKCAKSYLKQIESNYKKGQASIILMHDINVKSAHMLEYILDKLKDDKIDWKFDLIENIPAVKARDIYR